MPSALSAKRPRKTRQKKCQRFWMEIFRFRQAAFGGLVPNEGVEK